MAKGKLVLAEWLSSIGMDRRLFDRKHLLVRRYVKACRENNTQLLRKIIRQREEL